MPSPATLPTKPKKAPTATKTSAERKVIYPMLEVKICQLENALAAAIMKKMLGWETQSNYTARMKKEKPKITDAETKLQNPIYTADDGEQIACWNNNNNRPLVIEKARELCQDILNLKWAGPITLPGETINGESIVLSRTGEVHQGQHRAIGLILAEEQWQQAKETPAGERTDEQRRILKNWPTEPVLETLLVTGVSDDPRVIQTIDNVLARTEADVFYTSEIFRTKVEGGKKVPMLPSEKKECSRMLAASVDLVWKRTWRDKTTYQSHSESMAFVERHPKLLECIDSIFVENQDRGISLLKLSPGQCAGMMYLMAASWSDQNKYLGGKPPSEKLLELEKTIEEIGQGDDGDVLKITALSKAQEFWTLMNSKSVPTLAEVRIALKCLVDADGEVTSRFIEKIGTLAKAWVAFREDQPINRDALKLLYKESGALLDRPTFGGIDLGPTRRAEKNEEEGEDGDDMTEEQLQERVEEQKKADREALARQSEENLKKFNEQQAKKKK